MNSSATIRRIQHEYIAVVKSHFREVTKDFEKSGLSPRDFLEANLPLIGERDIWIPQIGSRDISSISHDARLLLEDIQAFWSENATALSKAVSENCLLSIQLGDGIAPQRKVLEKVVRLGLYFDTVCLIDPFSIAAQFQKARRHFVTGTHDDILSSFLMQSLTMSTMAPILTADVDQPIVIIMPPSNVSWNVEKDRKRIAALAAQDSFLLFSDVFNKRVKRLEDVRETLANYSLEKLQTQMENHDLLKGVFKGTDGSFLGFVRQSQMISPLPTTPKSEIVDAWYYVYRYVEGCYMGIEGAEISASTEGVDIHVDEHLWPFYVYRNKAREKLVHRSLMRDETIIQAAILSDELDWLATAQVEDLIRLRQSGQMEDIRELYRIGRHEIQKASVGNLQVATNAVVNSLTKAIQDYEKTLESLPGETRKTFGLDVVYGSIGIAASAVPFSSLFLPGKSIWDVWQDYDGLKKKQQEVIHRPVAHMFNIWKRSNN